MYHHYDHQLCHHHHQHHHELFRNDWPTDQTDNRIINGRCTGKYLIDLCLL
jgi:hypothetical protein